MEEEKLHFKTNVQLKSIIGKDLINDDNIAILELVKNSFDADAKKVNVEYQNLKNNDDKSVDTFSDKTSRIIIKDDGQGMNLTDVQDKWLNIAYSEKKSNSRQHNRMMAGAKGVGRFSCDRLGEYLNMYSKKENSNEYILLKIDWKKFEIEDEKQEIQNVNLDFEILLAKDLEARGIQLFNHGVLLEIIKLRSNWVYELKDNKGKHLGWNTEKFVNLKKYLEKLINPNQAFEENDFGIHLDAPEFIEENKQNDEHNKFLGPIVNTIFDKLDFKATSIESKIIEEGSIIYTELKDKGETIFWIREKNEFAPEIKDVKITLYYLNPYSKAFFTKQMGIRSVQYGSIYVFLNGFRIPPYGEYGDDWLYLEQRKGQGYAKFLSQRELVGRIEILDNSNSFKVISSREGIEKNDSYRKLTDQKNGYFFKTFKRLEKYVVDGLDWDSIPEEDKNKINEIERKIISGETKEDDLTYRENESTKRRRIYGAIHSIISAKSENVDKLYINENLILDKINEEKENSEREFEQLVSDFGSKKIDADFLYRVLQKKVEQNKDLEKQILDLAKYPIAGGTTKALLELQYYKETNKKQEQVIENLILQLNKLNEEKHLTEEKLFHLKKDVEIAVSRAKEEETKRIKVEKEKEEIRIEKEKIKIEKEEKEKQVLFHQKLLSKETQDLLEYHHNIGIASSAIEGYLINLKDDLTKGKIPQKRDLLELIENINYETNKIISITNFATSANFNADADEIDADLDEFIIQYILRVKQGKLKSSSGDNMQISISNKFHNNFHYHFKPLEIAIVLDNLLSNSRKAKATEIIVSILDLDEKNLVVSFKDNGDGVPTSNSEKIFEFGFTTTSGSGLGLYHLKKIINNKYNSTIELNKSLQSGAEFIINFKK